MIRIALSIFLLSTLIACAPNSGEFTTGLGREEVEKKIADLTQRRQNMIDTKPSLRGEVLADSLTVLMCDCIDNLDYQMVFEMQKIMSQEMLELLAEATESDLDDPSPFRKEFQEKYDTPDARLFDFCSMLWKKYPNLELFLSSSEIRNSIVNASCAENFADFNDIMAKSKTLSEETMRAAFSGIEMGTLETALDGIYNKIDEERIPMSEQDQDIKNYYESLKKRRN